MLLLAGVFGEKRCNRLGVTRRGATGLVRLGFRLAESRGGAATHSHTVFVGPSAHTNTPSMDLCSLRSRPQPFSERIHCHFHLEASAVVASGHLAPSSVGLHRRHPQAYAMSRAAPAKAKSLVELAESATKKRKQSGRRSLDAVVDRAIADQFAGWSVVATDVKLVDGLTLRQRILRDKEAAASSKQRLGANYWKELRCLYALDDQAMRKLGVANPSDLVSPALVSALEQATATNTNQRNKTPLLHYLASAPDCNQKELVGLLRSIMELKPSAVGSSAAIITAVLKFICRLGLDRKYPSEVEFVRTHMDEALATT